MKKIALILFALIVLSLSLASCVKESPEPVYTPNQVSPEDRVLKGSEDSGGMSFQLYNDNTCELAGVSAEAQSDSSSLVIPEKYGDYTVIAICESALENTSFTSVTIPDTVKSIGNFAFRRSAIREITLPAELQSMGAECFDNCLNLEKVTFSGSLKTIPLGAFYGCASLTELHLPEGVEIIEEEAFASLTNLESITLPSTLKEIGPWAFWNTGVESLRFSIPEGVEKIGKSAFDETAWLKGQTEEFVTVGDGILLAYRGSETEITLPAEIRYLSNAFDKSSVTILHLNASLEGVCDGALEESKVTSVTYSGDAEEVEALAATYQNS